MKNIFKIIVLSMIFILFTWMKPFAQVEKDIANSEQKVEIVLEDGGTYIGYIVKEEEKCIYLKTKDTSEVKIPLKNIAVIKNLSNMGYSFSNCFSGEYFNTESAIPIKKGAIYYKNMLIANNSLIFGMTDNLSLGLRTDVFYFSAGLLNTAIKPKFTYPISKNLHASMGVELGVFYDVYSKDVESSGAGFGVITLGDADRNVSLSVSVPMYSQVKELAEPGKLVTSALTNSYVNLSALYRVSKGFVLVSENTMTYSESKLRYLGTHGVRVLVKSNVFDFGISSFKGLNTIWPTIGYTRVF